MKRKRLNRDGWGFMFYPYYQMRVDDDLFHGSVCLIRFTDGEANYWQTPKAGRIQVTGAGMTWLQLIPDDSSHVITIKYFPDGIHDSERKNYPVTSNPKYQPSIWYVDIIDGIEYDEDGVAVFIDKYLDVIFTPEGDVKVDDRDELDGALASGDINKEQLVEMMLGYQVEGRVHTREVALDDVIFKAEHISGEKMPKDFSFELHKGEILGVWGLLGSGRSELFNTILGIDKMTEGKLWFKQDGELREITQRDFYKHVGYLTEGRHYDGLFLQMPIFQNITSSDLDQFAAKGVGVLNSAKEHTESRRLIEQVGVKTPDENVKVSKLSGGNQQKVIIAKWFLKDPEILFMDEPTKGVDVGAKNDIKELIFEKAEKGTSFVVISSELEEIMSLCDRIIVIYEGRLVGEVQKADFSKESLMKGIVSQEEKDAE
ncbi:MAG: ATP-binding cassette domain-containing protein [Oscillospiraceae bacterium]|nr:ATP-binding cassette domain-containing protein [Oscillospiraceae bacterium]